MLKATYTGKGRLHLSLGLIGLLFLCSAPKAFAQDAPPSPANDGAANAQSPSDQAPTAPPQAAPPQAAPPATAPPISNGPGSAGAADQADPPNRAARISLLDGSVSLQPGGQGDWGNAVRNRPVTVGDKVWSDKDARAELQAGQATLHLGSMTALSFLNLDGTITQMRLAEGSMNFRVREMREGDLYEVDTPNVAFTVKQAGAFRIDVSENGDGTRITAIRGEGDVTAAGQTYTVHTGERAEFVGTDGNVQYTAHGAPPPDSLDRWANDRDLREDNSVSARYVNRDVPGYSDLDDHGTWSEEPNVGSVWTPNDVAPDWAPYSDGNWNYVGPWGWSWVGYEPWGFAPYHYGRWGLYGGRWGWAPGPIWATPYYGPAFVGFLGGGFGVGLGFGFGFGGGVGWFPLGFGEPFHPWYHAGAGYIRNVNINNTVIRNNSVLNNTRNFNYAYAHNEHAVTTASRNTFVNGDRVSRGGTNITAASLRNAQVTSGAGFAPTRASYTGAGRTGAGVATPPSSVQNRAVVARTTPAAAAAHSAVHTTGSVSTNRTNSPSATPRQNQLAQNRPATANNNSTRTWAAQGNVTDRGTSPQGAGLGRQNSPATNYAQTSRNTQSDRPEWARGTQGTANTARSYSNRASAQNTNRSSQPQRSAPSRTYSAPSRSYSAPSRSSSAPSRSSGGGASHAGGASHTGGGGGHH